MNNEELIRPIRPIRPIHRTTRVARCLCLWCMSLLAQPAVLYQNTFEKALVGKLPEDFLVLDGAFLVKEENGNKFMELPGAPLDSFAVQFGPVQTSDVAVSARIKGTAKGRRF